MSSADEDPTCALCLKSNFSLKMTLAITCECSLLLCYDCWKQAEREGKNNACFICKKVITGGLPQKDLDECNKMDKKFGPFECGVCKEKVKRKDYIGHLQSHCHPECKTFETKCGRFSTCTMKKHMKECAKCNRVRCDYCYRELSDQNHNKIVCFCGDPLFYCSTTRKNNPHSCDKLQCDEWDIYSVEFCSQCKRPCDECKRSRSNCSIIAAVLEVLKNQKQVDEEFAQLEELNKRLRQQKRKLEG